MRFSVYSSTSFESTDVNNYMEKKDELNLMENKGE